MEARAAAIRAGTANEMIWLLEHPPLYTAGTSAAADELLAPSRFRSTLRDAAAVTPIMGRGSAWAM
jgi:lipoate-protein ligase B